MNARKSRGGTRLISSKKRYILIILLFALGVIIVNGVRLLESKKFEYESKTTFIEELKSEIEVEKNKEKPKNTSSDDNITNEEYESLAREELGLIKKDEIVIKPR